MSGRNQAMNLTGMLDGIAGAFNGMGDAYAFTHNAIRNIARPEVNQNSSESLIRYAQWAQRNGFDDEARQYMALGYRQKEKETQEAKDAAKAGVMRDAINTGSEAMKLGEDGFLSAVDSRISGLRGQLNNTDDPTAIAEIQRQIDKLENKRGDFVIAADNENARRVVQLDRHIARLDKNDPNYQGNKASLEKVRADILAKGDTETTYDIKKLDLLELENKKSAAKWTQQSSAIVTALKQAGTDPVKFAEVQARFPEFAAQIAAISPEILAQNETLEKLSSDNFRVESLPDEISVQRKRIDDSSLTEKQKADLHITLNSAERAINGGGVHPNSAIKSYENALNRIDTVFNQELSADAGVQRERLERYVVEAQRAGIAARKGPEQKEIVALVEAKTGEKWVDLDVDEQRTLAEEAERELMGPLLDYWERANIAAGLEPPKEFDAEDVQTVKAEIKEQARKDRDAGLPAESYEVSIQRKAYELAAEGYDRDAVIDLLTKETTLSLSQAEDYYEQIMADVEVNDERIAALVQESINAGGDTASVASKVYIETVKTRVRGNRTVDPSAVSNDHATRTRERLLNPDNRWQGITLTPNTNKLAAAYAEQAAGRGFRYPSMSELQPVSSSNRRR